MGFCNLEVTERGSASTASTSNTIPTFLCLPICACHLHQGLVDNQKQSSVCCPDWTSRGRLGIKGTEAPLNTDLGLLIR